ncbi:GerAB/ArcD/ProY family transporter [Neobacillus ginsengisoli]|uniref:Spore germination protein (Amino acid permease) n=1 Tax=Neobacillus ginsengisoli TaxID=904295 RepID=A0ABT9XXE7_9BACI|nr:endospore germination permease [Neobacillus ginsengisoli]MDQ0200068.1 spore germination protein (amino acid permease) [Neobacillus ginsengisoli]
MNQKINIGQMASMIILSTGLLSHVMLIPLLLQSSKRDAWLSVIMTSGVFSLWVPLLYYILKKTESKHITIWLKEYFGTVISYLFLFIFVLYLLFMSTMTLRETITFNEFYLPNTPGMVIAFALSLICFYNSFSGIRSIAITSGVLLPIVVVLGFFVMTANIPHKNFTMLKPFLENGFHPVLMGTSYTGSGFIEMVIIVFMVPYLNSSVKWRTLLILFFILMILILGPLIGAITEFGPEEAENFRYPAFEEWRLVSIGRYIEHLDFLSVYQWLAGAFIRISLSTFLLVDLLSIKKKRQRMWSLVSLYLVYIFLAVYPISDMKYFAFLTVYFPWSLVVVTGITILIALNIFITSRIKKVRI